MTPRGRSGGRSAPPRPAPAPDQRASLTALRERLTAVIESATGRVGFELERVSVSRVGRRYRVQVVVDRDEGVGLDAIAEVSRVVSAALDAAEDTGAAQVPGEYVLEVSSPGVERPLTEPRHWRRNLGRLVTVAVAGDGQLTGRVQGADAAGVTLEVEGTTRELPYGQLGPGRVQVELRRLETAQDEDAYDEHADDEHADDEHADDEHADDEDAEGGA